MRLLKYHEQKLLRKVNLTEWKQTNTKREQIITQKYVLGDRETYAKYNLVVGKIKRISLALAKLNDNDETKREVSKELCAKLHSVGLIAGKALLECAKVGVGSFCKRRLAVVIANQKMAPDVETADTFVRHGHVKVGAEVVCDPGLLITKTMEDYITWRDQSKVKQTVDEFKNL